MEPDTQDQLGKVGNMGVTNDLACEHALGLSVKFVIYF